MKETGPMRSAQLAVTILMLGCVASFDSARAADEASGPACRQESPSRFLIDGEINEALVACVRRELEPTTRELVVRSKGGGAEAAMDIAELLAPLALEMRVRSYCMSSCANYLLPVARRLVVEPGAVIVVHGSIDPQFLHKSYVTERKQRLRDIRATDPELTERQVLARYQLNFAHTRALVARQQAFMRRHGVRPGWMLYREPGLGGGGLDRFLEGSPTGGRWFRIDYLAVEEPFIRSCLPWVEVAPFQADLQRSFDDAARYKRFRRAGGGRTASLRCTTFELPDGTAEE